MKRSKILLSAVLAGLCVGFGGIVFLSVDNKVIGSAAFTIGLFVICTFGFHLFTGKVCYVLQNDRNYALDLPVIWLGNLIGTGLTAGCAALTRIGPAVQEKAASLCQVMSSATSSSILPSRGIKAIPMSLANISPSSSA